MADIAIFNATRTAEPTIPLGPLYLCAVLEDREYDVMFADYQTYEGEDVGSPPAFGAWLDVPADVVGISTLSSSLPLVLAGVRELKARSPDKTVILGGPGTGRIERDILQLLPDVDIVVRGEGEETLLEVMEKLTGGESLQAVRGITYRAAGAVRENPSRPRNNDLDALPYPAYDRIDVSSYAAPQTVAAGVLTTRGCPYRCSFCDVSAFWGRQVQQRSVEDVIGELRLLRDYHDVRAFRFLDDIFILDAARVRRLSTALTAARLDMPWVCHARVDLMTDQLLQCMVDAGCRGVYYGVESGSDRILEQANKGFQAEQAFDVVERTLEYCDVSVSLIWGFPFEEEEDLLDTIAAGLHFAQLGAEVQFNMLVPLPSSPLYAAWKDHLSRRLRWEVVTQRCAMDAYEYSPELSAFIRRYPELFMAFFYFETERFAAHKELIDRFCLDDFAAARRKPPYQPLDGTAFSFMPATGVPLPGLKIGVTVRAVGGRPLLVDTVRGEVHPLDRAYALVARGCSARADSGRLAEELAAEAGAPPLEEILTEFYVNGYLV